MDEIILDDIPVAVVRKRIRNLRLSVHPPEGTVRISAPLRMSLDTIRNFALSKLGWIKRQQQKLRDQEREEPREYLDRESHLVWGERRLLRVEERDSPPHVLLDPGRLVLRVRPGTDTAGRQAVVAAWQREELRQATLPLIDAWEARLGVTVTRLYVRYMKTRWGTCNTRAGSIRLNSELARKPRECLEYIVVHEMVHLLEPSHNQRFQELMDRFLPAWRNLRRELNRLPVRHDLWEY